jgi:hypothetical protein
MTAGTAVSIDNHCIFFGTDRLGCFDFASLYQYRSGPQGGGTDAELAKKLASADLGVRLCHSSTSNMSNGII